MITTKSQLLGKKTLSVTSLSAIVQLSVRSSYCLSMLAYHFIYHFIMVIDEQVKEKKGNYIQSQSENLVVWEYFITGCNFAEVLNL